MNYPGLLNRGYDKAQKPEQAFIIVYLTFLYISFAKKFCQKKSRKTVSMPPEFSFKTLISCVRRNTENMRRFCVNDVSVAAARMCQLREGTPATVHAEFFILHRTTHLTCTQSVPTPHPASGNRHRQVGRQHTTGGTAGIMCHSPSRPQQYRKARKVIS